MCDMGKYADAAARIEAKADLIEERMPDVAVAARNAAKIIHGYDKYSR